MRLLEPTAQIRMKIDPYYHRLKYRPMTLVSENIRFMLILQGFRWAWASNIHPNKMPVKNFEKKERGRIQGLPHFFRYPLLSKERVKLRTSNLANTCTGSIQTKALQKFSRKGSMGISRSCPIFDSYPLLSQRRVKLRTSNLLRTFIGPL